MGVVCCDLDGVVWRGDDPIPGAAPGIAELRAHGHRVVFVTNNSGSTRDHYADKLLRCGIGAVRPDDLVTSAGAAAEWMAANLAPGSSVHCCAGDGVREALRDAGLEPTDTIDTDAVVVGWHRTFDFDRLARAADVARRPGTCFVATNEDPTYPAAHGELPGAGALLAAVATAARRAPDVVAGKPHAPMRDAVARRCGPPALMIGDRASTDGAFARTLGCAFGFVRTGVAHDSGDVAADFAADDLDALVTTWLASGH